MDNVPPSIAPRLSESWTTRGLARICKDRRRRLHVSDSCAILTPAPQPPVATKTNRMLKKPASFVLARHWALTDSRPCASMRRLIRRLAHLRGSTYGHGKRACLGRLGRAGKNAYASPQELPAHGTLGTHRLAPVRKRETIYSSSRAPRRRPQTWRSLFFTPWTWLRPRWRPF